MTPYQRLVLRSLLWILRYICRSELEINEQNKVRILRQDIISVISEYEDSKGDC